MRVAVTGATGFVGSALVRALDAAGHEVTALSRDPAKYHGPGIARRFDIGEVATIGPALEDQEAAYYLVHSLASTDFKHRDRAGAEAFAAGSSRVGLRQVVYLGGLGDSADELSEHLRSRRDVESVLLAGAPTTALRAGIVIGDGGISWEILRQLVVRLPVMVTPRWVQTRTQPIALADAVADLVGVLGRADMVGDAYEIGGSETLTYRGMMLATAKVMGRRRLVAPVPFLTPRVSAHWLRLITDVDLPTARALIDSMANEVVVRDDRILGLLGHTRMRFEVAVATALADRASRLRHAGPGAAH